MARIYGIDLKPNLQIQYSLAEIYGVGLFTAKKMLKDLKVDPETLTKDVEDSIFAKITKILEENYKVEGELRQEEFRNIKRLKDIRSYRGDRHKKNLPTKGQGTRKNARNKKGHSMAVGGLKRVLTKT